MLITIFFVENFQKKLRSHAVKRGNEYLDLKKKHYNVNP